MSNIRYILISLIFLVVFVILADSATYNVSNVLIQNHLVSDRDEVETNQRMVASLMTFITSQSRFENLGWSKLARISNNLYQLGLLEEGDYWLQLAVDAHPNAEKCWYVYPNTFVHNSTSTAIVKAIALNNMPLSHDTDIVGFKHSRSIWHEDVYTVILKGLTHYRTTMYAEDDGDCIYRIEFEEANIPFRTSQRILVESNQRYILTALVKNNGITKGYIGIESKWQGATFSQCTDVTNWCKLDYQFVTGSDQDSEGIAIILISGIGDIQVRDVSMRKVQGE